MEFTLFRRQSLALTASKTAASEQIQIALSDVSKLPTLPDTATRAMAMVNDPDSSLTDFSRFVERDPPLAAAILKLVNSPIYHTGRQIQSLNQAVVRLGLRQCQNLIIAVGMQGLFSNVKPSRKKLCEDLWDHSFITGCLCRKLASIVPGDFEGEEFTVGLLHDLGRILIAVACPEIADTDVFELVEGPEILDREREVLGSDHCALGSWFAMQNKLPGSVVSSIRFHHTPEHATTNEKLTALLAMAEHMANAMHTIKKPEEYDLTANRGFRVLAEDWSEEEEERISELVPGLLAEMSQGKGFSRTVSK